MTRKDRVAKKSELCDMYTDAIDDFRKFFENKKKLIKAKCKKEQNPKQDSE